MRGLFFAQNYFVKSIKTYKNLLTYTNIYAIIKLQKTKGDNKMKQYTDEALKMMQENTMKLYEKLANLKPTDGFTLQDIESTMYYLKSFADEARHERYIRKIAELRNK